MAAVPNRERLAAAGWPVCGAAAVERECAVVPGQRATVARPCALGFTPAQVRYGLGQGFASLEEVADFLFGGGAADADVQSVLADAAVRPAGTSPLRPAAAPGTQQLATQEVGDQSASGGPGTAPPRAERIPGVAPDQGLGVAPDRETVRRDQDAEYQRACEVEGEGRQGD
eukprot:COSAG02_NODE_11_length_58539_cov_103.119473_31_plen_171_part_00